MLDFEKYSADQFPFREGFRTIKAIFSKYCLNKKENNGIFTSMGHVSKLDGEINQSMLDYSVKLFRSIYEKNIKNTNSNLYLTPRRVHIYVRESLTKTARTQVLTRLWLRIRILLMWALWVIVYTVKRVFAQRQVSDVIKAVCW